MSTTTLIIVAIYVIINIISFSMYLADKRKAVKGEWRTTENALILSGLFGPFGAVIGMHVAHHKTQKIKFKLNYIFLVLHIVLIVFLIIR